MYLDKRKIKIPTPPLPLPYKGGEWLRLRARHVLTFKSGLNNYVHEEKGTLKPLHSPR